MLNRLVTEAGRIAYKPIHLGSACIMLEAHQLYRSIGFQEINLNEESEITIEFQKHWVF